MTIPRSHTFQKKEVLDYERTRYRRWDQKLVDAREKRILGKIFKKIRGDIQILLDVPCGYGRFSGLVLGQKVDLLSSDISFEMVKRACQRSPHPERHHALVTDAKQGLPFKTSAIDGLLSMRFFHHIHRSREREAVLKEFARISSRWIILSFYQTNFLHALQRKLRGRMKKNQRKIAMIRYKELKQALEGAGLQAVKVFSLFKGIHAQKIILIKTKSL